jgi:hypothetical protein
MVKHGKNKPEAPNRKPSTINRYPEVPLVVPASSSFYKRAAAPRTITRTPAAGMDMLAAAPVLVAAAEAEEAADDALREADDWTEAADEEAAEADEEALDRADESEPEMEAVADWD